MIFRQVEAIYYTQKRISDQSVWREEGPGKVDRISFLGSLAPMALPGPACSLCLGPQPPGVGEGVQVAILG